MSTRAPLTEPAEDVMGHGEHAGAAMRRRERRLRAMLRHERMTVAMVLSEKKHHTSRGQNKDRTMGEENVMNCTAKLRKTPPPTAASTEDDPMVLDEGGALVGQHLCLRLLAGRSVCSGTAWSILPKSAPSCRFSMPMFLCRCWWISTLRSGTWKRTSWSPLIIWIAISRFLSWLSKYPRSASTSSLSAPWFLSRSWRNSWWKYRRPCLTLRYSGLWNSTSTFQFLVVEGEFLVLKVFFPGRVQQRFMVPWNAFLSGLWRRTLISPSVETTHRRLSSRVPLFVCVTFRWTSAGSPSQELPSDGRGDDCVLLGGTSSSRSPRPLPCFPLSSTETGDGKGRGGGRELKFTAAFREMPPPGGWRAVLLHGRRRGSASRRAASTFGRGAAADGVQAALWQRLRARSRCHSAADGS